MVTIHDTWSTSNLVVSHQNPHMSENVHLVFQIQVRSLDTMVVNQKVITLSIPPLLRTSPRVVTNEPVCHFCEEKGRIKRKGSVVVKVLMKYLLPAR